MVKIGKVNHVINKSHIMTHINKICRYNYVTEKSLLHIDSWNGSYIANHIIITLLIMTYIMTNSLIM